MSDRIAVMSDGNILQVDKPYDLYEEPRNRVLWRILLVRRIS